VIAAMIAPIRDAMMLVLEELKADAKTMSANESMSNPAYAEFYEQGYYKKEKDNFPIYWIFTTEQKTVSVSA